MNTFFIPQRMTGKQLKAVCYLAPNVDVFYIDGIRQTVEHMRQNGCVVRAKSFINGKPVGIVTVVTK